MNSKIAEKIKKLIASAAENFELDVPDVNLEHPEILSHGDYSSNVALVVAKEVSKAPKEIAEELKKEIEKNLPEEVERVEVAGAGFLNFYLSRKFFADSVAEIIACDDFGKGDALEGKMALFEYTDPNPFKAFHIGHLMANAVGEALSRLAEMQSAEVSRICYQGDIGLHVAKTIWGMEKAREAFPEDGDTLGDKIKFMGDAYVSGTNAYEDDEKAQNEIKIINKKLFSALGGSASGGEKSDSELQTYYNKGKKWSLEHFEEIYKILDTKFDEHIFESEMAEPAVQIVRDNPNVFVESEGAVVFKGEEHGLHTRVFLTSQGLPTYEAKDTALFFRKAKEFPKHDLSLVVTANEQSDYFKVLQRVFALLSPELAKKFTHISHGLLRFTEGKMSSRKGNIITAEAFIDDVKDVALSKINKEGIEEKEKEKIAEAVVIAAIKYSILRQSPGKDIIFDKEKSLSFEGDSGPYLQYAYVRSSSLLEKANTTHGKGNPCHFVPEEIYEIEKMLYRFPEVTSRAWAEKAPQLVVEYLTHLASAFNGFYAKGTIVSGESDSPYKVAITKAFNTVMQNGLHILAIPLLQKM
ncbi:MAG TPA: arginine--tRNA ligase [Candidatus Paceibacterota bacterium]